MTEPLLKPCEGFSLKVEDLEPLMRVQTYSWPGPEYVGLGPAPKKHRPWLEWIRTKIFSLPPRFIPAEIWRRFPINDWTTSWKALGEEESSLLPGEPLPFFGAFVPPPATPIAESFFDTPLGTPKEDD